MYAQQLRSTTTPTPTLPTTTTMTVTPVTTTYLEEVVGGGKNRLTTINGLDQTLCTWPSSPAFLLFEMATESICEI